MQVTQQLSNFYFFKIVYFSVLIGYFEFVSKKSGENYYVYLYVPPNDKNRNNTVDIKQVQWIVLIVNKLITHNTDKQKVFH